MKWHNNKWIKKIYCILFKQPQFLSIIRRYRSSALYNIYSYQEPCEMPLSILPKKRIRNRRFLLVLAFLSLDLYSENNLELPWNDVYTNDFYHLDDYELKSGSILWLVDRHNGDCLGTNGFSECGSDTNLWKFSFFEDSFYPYSSHIRFEVFENNHFMENTISNNPICLGRKVQLGVRDTICFCILYWLIYLYCDTFYSYTVFLFLNYTFLRFFL